MDDTADLVVGVIFWIGAWQLATLLSEKLSKQAQIIIYLIITIVSLIFIFHINKKKKCKKDEDRGLLIVD